MIPTEIVVTAVAIGVVCWIVQMRAKLVLQHRTITKQADAIHDLELANTDLSATVTAMEASAAQPKKAGREPKAT